MFPYVGVGVLVVTLVLTGFFATVSRISLFILHGLNVYVLPEDSEKTSAGNGAEKETDTAERLKKKSGKRKKEKDVFDEGGAQIIRIRLADAQLESRKYFQQYDEAVIYSILGVTSILTREVLQLVASSSLAKERGWTESLTPDDRISFMVCVFVVYKLFRLLAKVNYDPQLARKSERLLNWTAGVLGFMLASAVLVLVPASIIDFGIKEMAVEARRSASLFMRKKGIQAPEEIAISTAAVNFLLALMSGICSSILFGPALRNAKNFWVATDQVERNLTLLKRSGLIRPFLNLSIVLPLFVPLVWVNPMGEIFVRPLIHANSVQVDSGDAQNCRTLEENTAWRSPYSFGKLEELVGKDSRCVAGADPHDCSITQSVHNCEVGALGRCDRSRPMDPIVRDAKRVISVDAVFLRKETMQYEHDMDEEEMRGLGRVFLTRQYDWAENFGVSEDTFGRIRLWCLIFIGLLQIFLLRVNLQTYCDGGVLLWYENLHQSRAHNLELTKAKIFLNNYFICRVAVQCLVPGVLVVLIIGLARTRGSHLDHLVQEGNFLLAPSFVRAVMHFGAWWLVIVTGLQSWVTLALFRVGLLTSTA